MDRCCTSPSISCADGWCFRLSCTVVVSDQWEISDRSSNPSSPLLFPPSRWDQRVRQKHNAAFINPPFLSALTHTKTITTKQEAEGHFLPYEFSFLGTFIFILSHSVSPFLAMSQECGKNPVCVCVCPCVLCARSTVGQ